MIATAGRLACKLQCLLGDGLASKRTVRARKRTQTRRQLHKRRAPEQARAELLDAAEQLLSERGPDAVGLRDVAQRAGVSHGLITHYFGTYDALVEAVFARRIERIASDVVLKLEQAVVAPSVEVLVRLLLASVSEPIHLRLVAWAMLSGRANSLDFLPGRQQGLRGIADAVQRAAAVAAERNGTLAPSQEDVDYALLLALGAVYGYGLGKAPFLLALGRKPSPQIDEAVTERLIDMVQAVLRPAAPKDEARKPPRPQ
jgi:AcrR family transcriptional regulator